MAKKSIYDRLKELKFYYPNNESGELFISTCQLCYKMEGMGEEDKAEVLYKWAKEQVECNRSWCTSEGMSLRTKDFVTGLC